MSPTHLISFHIHLPSLLGRVVPLKQVPLAFLQTLRQDLDNASGKATISRCAEKPGPSGGPSILEKREIDVETQQFLEGRPWNSSSFLMT